MYSDAIENAGFTPETPCENTAQFFDGFGQVPARGYVAAGGKRKHGQCPGLFAELCVRLYHEAGNAQTIVDFLHSINIKSKLEPYPSICLGAVEISLYEMLWDIPCFLRGFSTKPYYFSRIEDKNGNVLARFDTERKEVISQNTAYTMCRMMQGTVDIGTAAGMRDRWVLQKWVETGTTQVIRTPGSWDILHSCWPVSGLDAMIILFVSMADWEKAEGLPGRSGIFLCENGSRQRRGSQS